MNKFCWHMVVFLAEVAQRRPSAEPEIRKKTLDLTGNIYSSYIILIVKILWVVYQILILYIKHFLIMSNHEQKLKNFKPSRNSHGIFKSKKTKTLDIIKHHRPPAPCVEAMRAPRPMSTAVRFREAGLCPWRFCGEFVVKHDETWWFLAINMMNNCWIYMDFSF